MLQIFFLFIQIFFISSTIFSISFSLPALKYFPSYRDNFSAAALSELVPGAGGDHGQCARHRVVAAAGAGALQGRAHHRRAVAQEIIVQEL